MISLDIKKETSSSLSPLNTAPTEKKEGALSFSALLKGTQELDDKIIQNGSLILALKDEKAPVTLLSTPDVQDIQDMTELESLELDSKVSIAMTPEDLKILIKEAKQFLKDKIVQSEGFKKAEIDALPKTLNGLVQVAKKIGIDISKITLEEVKAQTPKTVQVLHVKSDRKTEKEPLHVSKNVNQEVSADNKLKKQEVYNEKVLINEAKQFLKDKIVQSEGFQKAEIDALPKTLNGLVQVAKKIGIDISKITLEEVKAQTPKTVQALHVKSDRKTEKEPSHVSKNVNQEVSADNKLKKQEVYNEKVLIKEAKQFLKDKIVQSEGFKKAEIDALPKTLNGLVQVAKKIGIDISKIMLEDVKAQTPKTVQALHVSKEVNQEVPAQNVELPDDTKVKKQKVHKNLKPQEIDTTEENLEMPKKETNKNVQQVKQEVKLTPLFKAQNSAVEITTQQIVNTKVNNLTVQKNPKQKTENTLQLLLRGEKISKNDTGLTADFSVATAKVIAPQATKKADKSLESLLKNDVSDDAQTKTDGLQVAKADSFEVKLNEAKQMVKYLSQDVKSAIEDYKSPFTRIKVQLNPQRLGEVDLTIVQRGKNLHINLSSNNTAINTLAMNANDLKVQLNNNGINNASLNFNSNPQGDNSQAGQQEQHRQHQQRADEEYAYFESQEGNEEILSSLEIVVPYYA